MSRYDSSSWLGIFWIVFILISIGIGLGRGIFANPDVAVRTLETQGYSDIQIVDHAWFAVGLRGCDAKDAARFTAMATNPVGNLVKVYVCTGVIFKGGTIRVR